MSASSDLTSQVLDLVRAGLGPRAEAEVLVMREESALTRFANSFIHQNVATDITHVRIRLHLAGRTASATTTGVDPDSLHTLVTRAANAARLLPPDPLWAGLTPPTGTPGTGTPGTAAVDDGTAAAAPIDRVARVRAFVDAAGGLGTAGYCRTSHVQATFANTAGQLATGAYTDAGFDGIARAPDPSTDGGTADGVSRAASNRLADLDGAALGERAAAKARAAVAPAYLPPGNYEVVLEPEAVADVLELLGTYGFNGKAVQERRSFATPGAAQFDPCLSIVDDPVGPRIFGLPYDTEGTPKRRLDLVRAGVTTALTHDRRTAREAGAASTGHAGPGSDVGGPVASHLTFEPAAGATVAPDVGDLVSGVRRGLLVSDFWYTRVLDPRPLVITGLTRNGVWLIESGEIVGPVRNLRFTQAYPQALAPGHVLGIGGRAVTQPSSWGFAAYRAPALRLASWRFTGGAQG